MNMRLAIFKAAFAVSIILGCTLMAAGLVWIEDVCLNAFGNAADISSFGAVPFADKVAVFTTFILVGIAIRMMLDNKRR